MFRFMGSTRLFASAVTLRLRRFTPLAACMIALLAIFSPLGGCASSGPAANGSHDKIGEETAITAMTWQTAKSQLSGKINAATEEHLDSKFPQKEGGVGPQGVVTDVFKAGLGFLARRIDEHAASYEARFQAQVYQDRWFNDSSRVCEIIKIARRTTKSGDKHAFELYVAVLPFESSKEIFTLKPIYLDIRAPKARIAGDKINVTVDLAIDAGWYASGDNWQDERLAVCSFNIVATQTPKNSTDASDSTWKWNCDDIAKAEVSGYFPKKPVGSNAVVRYSAVVNEQDATRARENLQRAAQFLRKNTDAIVETVK